MARPFAAAAARIRQDAELEPATESTVRVVRGGLAGQVRPLAGVDAQLGSFHGTVYSVVDKIARRVAQLPVRLLQTTRGVDGAEDSVEIFDHPFLSVLGQGAGRRPNEEDSVSELRYSTQASLDLTGEAWWLVERSVFGAPARITHLPSNRMTIALNEQTGRTAGHIFKPLGALPSEELFIPKLTWEELIANPTQPFIFFARYPDPRGVESPRGWSPVAAAALAVDIRQAELTYKRSFLQNSAQLGGILQTEAMLTRPQIKEYLEEFDTAHRGARKAGAPLVLPRGLTWQTTEANPRESMNLETVKLTREEILFTYGVSESKLGKADIGNRATADAMDVVFNREVVAGRLGSLEEKLESDFLPVYPEQSEQVFFQVQFDNPVPADREFELKREDQDVVRGVRTRNQVRVDRGLEPFGELGDMIPVPNTLAHVDPVTSEIFLLAAPAAEEEETFDEPDEVEEAERSFVRQLNDPSIDTLLAVAFEGADDALLLRVTPIIQEIIEEEGAFAMMLLGGDPGDFDTLAAQTEYLARVDLKIKGINRTTQDSLRRTLRAGVSDDDSLNKLRLRVAAVMLDAKFHRTETIARTLSVGSKNHASQRGMKQGGAEAKEWLATSDPRVRDTHSDANGQIVAIDEPFSVGGALLQYPGDPGGLAEEVINCRCTQLPAKLKRSVFPDEGLREKMWQRFAADTERWESRFRPRLKSLFGEQERVVLEQLSAFV